MSIVNPNTSTQSSGVLTPDFSQTLTWWGGKVVIPDVDKDPGFSGTPGTPYTPGCTGPTYLLDNTDNFVIIGGSTSPGAAKVLVTHEISWDHKKSPGQSFGITTFYGKQAAQFDIQITIWTYDQWVKFQSFCSPLFNTLVSNPSVSPTTGAAALNQPAVVGTNVTTGTGKAKTTSVEYALQWKISHPELEWRGISQCLIRGLVGPQESRGQARTYVLKCIQAVEQATQANSTATPIKPAPRPLDPNAPENAVAAFKNPDGQAGPDFATTGRA